LNQRGFTLIELGIALVIIGLLAVGVIKATGLINSAKAKDVVAIDGDLRNAITLFKKRFNYLPGDWPFVAGEIQGVVAGTSSGTNGNGVIEGSIDAGGNADLGSEVAELPWQLFNAGFLGKLNQNDPQKRIVTSFGSVHVVSRSTADALVPGFSLANPTVRHAIVFSGLPCEVAESVDSGLDNASLTSGRAIGSGCVNGSVAWYAIVL
jgi:prepilin-type N-terminal cleavage/methylation domain-containing protein